MGLNQVRMAYVLKTEDLADALVVLEKALEAYPGTKTLTYPIQAVSLNRSINILPES